ncbi:MAG: preprotein translocase subunit SecE [Mycobacterium sp.]
MTDELDRPDAAADGDDSDTDGRGPTAVVTRHTTGPLRPTGKRSRNRATSGADGGGDLDVVSTATELTETSEGDSGAGTERDKKAGKAKGKKKAGEPSRNPFVFVFNYLKQVVGELRKVIWPNRKQMVTYTSVVLAFLVFMVTLVAGSDLGFAKLVLLVFGE